MWTNPTVSIVVANFQCLWDSLTTFLVVICSVTSWWHLGVHGQLGLLFCNPTSENSHHLLPLLLGWALAPFTWTMLTASSHYALPCLLSNLSAVSLWSLNHFCAQKHVSFPTAYRRTFKSFAIIKGWLAMVCAFFPSFNFHFSIEGWVVKSLCWTQSQNKIK